MTAPYGTRRGDLKTCEFSPKEMASIEKLLRAMLSYEPPERITRTEAIGSEWGQD